jgi:hypothetical protein
MCFEKEVRAMKRNIVVHMVTIALACAAVGGAAAGEQPGEKTTAKVRIGAFDSRAIAMAHFGKLIRDGLLEELYAGHRNATASGDDERATELATKGQLIQKRLHRQMFGAAKAEDALAEIKPSLPKLADSLGVSVIVSVHDIAFQSPSVEVVDVTMEMVELFDPDQETLDKIHAVMEHPPIADSIIDRMESGYPPKDAKSRSPEGR